MSDSILTSVKKILNIAEDVTVFDADVVMHTNSAFAILNQLGIGPEQGFMIGDATPVWDDFLGGDPNLNTVKTYVYLRVRMLFDPPTTSFVIDSMNQQLEMFEWRLSVYRENNEWVDPNPPHIPEDEDLVLDGGQP